MLLPLLLGTAVVQAAQTLPPPEKAPPVARLEDASPPAPAAPRPAPKLVVAISVDQFSADLFAQYRQSFTGGFRRMLGGAVFPSGYQAHAATETCPGHSTILTGFRPDRTGIVANNWVDQTVGRADRIVYCAEDETVPGSTHERYTASDKHLLVPTLGERMKAADPRARVVSVAGKDRAAIMLGGHRVDQLWWWNGGTFATYAGRATPPVVARAQKAVADLLARPQPPLDLPANCRAADRAIRVGDQVLGRGRFERAAGDARAFRASPALDGAVLGLAAGLVQDMKLGRGPQTDLLAVGVSATDYIGHANGTQGAEMCIQMAELDAMLAGFFEVLDRTGVDYEVVLTADHGAHDLTERQIQRAQPAEAHAARTLKANPVGAAIAASLGLPGPVLLSSEPESGIDADVYISAALTPPQRARVQAEALRRYRADPQVAAVFTRAEIAASPVATTPPENWTLLERARASFDAKRSGDLVMLLRSRVTSVVASAPGYVETHGSPWDYDRRVPILFWRRGQEPFEQPLSVETVDIAPTLAATIGLSVPGLDGRCLDLDPGPGDTCRR